MSIRSQERPGRWRAAWTPYALLIPAAAVLVALWGYPLFKLLGFSFQRYGLREFITRKTVWNGLANYRSILSDHFFWVVVLRTVVFTAANVGLTLVGGLGVALLMRPVGRVMRTVMSVSMVLAWAMLRSPP